MKSLYKFIIKPLDERYNNKKNIGDKELIINSNIEIFQSVDKRAVVVATPAAFDTDIKIGDEIYIHHNIFRRYYDIRGKEKNSGSYFKDNLFFCEPHQIYLYKQNSTWYCNLDYCFVNPIQSEDVFSLQKDQPLLGKIKYSNSFLDSKGIIPGTLITFTPNSEFEFRVDNELLYCMKSNDIALRYEHEENKIKYNPSWA